MLKEEIQKAISSSLKEGRKTELKVLRFILSGIQYAEIDKQKDLTDEEIIVLLQKELKKRKEAIELFKKGGRTDLVEDEEKQLTVIEKYLPKQLSVEELNKIIDEVISSSGDLSNTGKIIGLVMAEVKGKADGKTVVDLVRQKILAH